MVRSLPPYRSFVNPSTSFLRFFSIHSSVSLFTSIPPSRSSNRSSTPTLSPADQATITSTEDQIRSLQQNIRNELAQGKYNQAKIYATECEKVTLNYYGEAHPVYASSLTNLSLVHKYLGLYTEAIQFSTKALEIYEKLTGKESASTATTLGNLGLLHLAVANTTKGFEKVGHIDAGYSVLQRVLGIRRSLLSNIYDNNNSSSTTTTTSNKESGTPISVSTDVPVSVIKSLQLNIGIALYQLASAARTKKQYEESEKLYQESLQYIQEHINDKNIYYATALNNLGYLYKEWKKYDKAETYYRQALRLRQQLLTPQHPDSIATYHNLAEVKRNQGQEEEAQKIQKDILNILGYKDEENTLSGRKEPPISPPPPDSRSMM